MSTFDFEIGFDLCKKFSVLALVYQQSESLGFDRLENDPIWFDHYRCQIDGSFVFVHASITSHFRSQSKLLCILPEKEMNSLTLPEELIGMWNRLFLEHPEYLIKCGFLQFQHCFQFSRVKPQSSTSEAFVNFNSFVIYFA